MTPYIREEAKPDYPKCLRCNFSRVEFASKLCQPCQHDLNIEKALKETVRPGEFKKMFREAVEKRKHTPTSEPDPYANAFEPGID